MPRAYSSRSWRTIGEFSASRRACSRISFLLLFFIVFLEKVANVANLDDEIRKCSDDSEHLRSVDQGLRFRFRLHDRR